MMNSRKEYTLLNIVTVFVIFVAILVSHSECGVEASRVLSGSQDFARANYLNTYTSAYEETKNTMAFWLQRLASGPSPKGPGH
ncbi:hypothetical protein TanjilG_10800 [Lupinus angustifolius]|uniref:Transmembrane protein n=1 Tax=Lupinus angustifolius TaxID=3871 RepID=A0A394DPX6_LUPAN|nr:PREDICTED: uncharacterized protein LOC109340574 [Lupinus angustifolius]OIW21777.1 hypothetical protein TanjilG_10800 [Lupinus angustifolius]